MDRAEAAKQQWSRELPGPSYDTMVLWGRLIEASERVMKQYLEPIYADHGLKFGEFDVLATLRRSGAPFTLMPAELLKTTMISSGGLTARLNRLEKARFIRRAPHETDRRVLLVILTEEGKDLVETILPRHMEAQATAIAGLPEADQTALRDILGRLVQTL